MDGKFHGTIQSITLDDASYQGTGETIEPTYINYFFGNNGSGKSTLARAIQTGTGVTYSPGKTAQDCLPLVFNQEYIDANMRSYRNLPGVFTVNKVNVDIERQIEGKQSELDAIKAELDDARDNKGKKEGEREDLAIRFQDDCWNKTKDIRERFDRTQEGKKKKKAFVGELIKHPSEEQDLDTLKRMYDSLYSSDTRTYQRFNEIADVSVLDNLPGKDILGMAIVNSSNTPFAEFLKQVGSTDWVRQGHEAFHAKAGDRCPYCSRKLDADFEDLLKASFDDQYQINLNELKTFLGNYRNHANELYMPINHVPEQLYPGINIKPYTDKLEALKNVISSNIILIQNKINEPSRIIQLQDTAPILEELSSLISGFNKLIDDNNAIVLAGPRKAAECTKAVFDHMAFMMKKDIVEYIRSNRGLLNEIKEKDAEINRLQNRITSLNSDLRELNSKTVETETAMRNINTMLRDTGFSGFEVRPHSSQPGSPVRNYEVVRTTTGEVAENLSEGEKNFIAFLYFQQRVFGNETTEGDTRDRIVVIDDPVSSMDSSALFVVSALVRKMVEICRNNADSRNPMVKGNFIKQIFILTHNAYFHREVTYLYASEWKFVSFYLITKTDNKSHISLCYKIDPGRPTSRMNINPVKNSYAALWDEYRELKATIPLMNVMRRILEYYFLQLCGYDGNDLRKCILEDNRESFIKKVDGKDDYSQYDLAGSLLSYIAASSKGVNDGINYVESGIDSDLCKETFHMIFKYMNQEQHYNMMMGIQREE